MQSLGISKRLKFGNECFEIIYYGKVLNIDFNKSEAERLLDDFIEKQVHSNMLENVAAVRSIFSGCREEVLRISYADEREYEAVQYNDLNLSLFKKEKMSMDNEHDVRYTFKYDSSGIKVRLL